MVRLPHFAFYLVVNKNSLDETGIKNCCLMIYIYRGKIFIK